MSESSEVATVEQHYYYHRKIQTINSHFMPSTGR